MREPGTPTPALSRRRRRVLALLVHTIPCPGLEHWFHTLRKTYANPTPAETTRKTGPQLAENAAFFRETLCVTRQEM